MASNTQLYTKADVFVDGLHLVEEASVQITRNTNSQAVNTVAKGYAGESPGAPMIEMTVEGAVPAADFELNPQKYMTDLKVAEFTVFAGNSTLTFKGFVVSDSFSHAVNAESKLTFTVRGSYDEWT